MPKSRSGSLRQSLGPLRVRLVNNISSIDTHIRTALSTDKVECQRQSDDIQELLSKIKSQITTITEKDNQWHQIITTCEDDELLTDEEALYAKVAHDPKEGYMTAVEYAKDKMCSLERKLVEAERQLSQAVATPATTSNNTTSGNAHGAAKLPKLSLPKFSGDDLDWSNFWNIFKTNVHDRDMNPSEKFAYLRGQLSGNAINAIDGIPVDDDGYPIAVQILKERFERSASQLVGALYSKLKRLPTSSDRVGDLLSTYDSCEKIFRQLESAGEKTDANRSLILEVFSKYPPAVVKDVMERQQVGPHSTLGEVRKALHQHIKQSENLAELLEDMDPFSSTSSKSNSKNEVQRSKPEAVRQSSTQQTSAFAASDKKPSNNQPQNPCYFCTQNHFNSMCDVYPTALDRIQQLQAQGRCGMCMSSTHNGDKCNATHKLRCFFCKTTGQHSSPLCPTKFGKSPAATITSVSVSAPPSNQLGNSSTTAPTGVSMLNTNEQALLLTAITTICNPETGKKSTARLILDSGSHRSYVTEQFSSSIGLQSMSNEALHVAVFGTQRTLSVESNQVSFEIIQRDGSHRIVYAHTTPVITNCPILPQKLPPGDVKILESMKYVLADDFTSGRGHIDILIGSDYFWEFLTGSKMLTPSGLYLIPSTLGYLVGGRYEESEINNARVPSLLCLTETTGHHMSTELGLVAARGAPSPSPDIDEFWSLERMGITDNPSVCDDDQALKQFNESICFRDGRYYVSWPWKQNGHELPTNFELAKGRLKSLAKRLQSSDPFLLQKYSEVLQDQLQKKVIEKVPLEIPTTSSTSIQPTTSGRVHYLPHHPVVKPSSTTTKVRIVYDASASSRKGSPSLNECLYRGPVLLPDLCHILIRFRLSPVVIVSDIEKAFLQMGLHETERDVTRFLWFKDPSSLNVEDIEIYRFCRVPFGFISSPFLLGGTIRYHLNSIGTDTAEQISRDIYVDNVHSGFDDEQQATMFYKDSKGIFDSAGMNLTEWSSNSTLVNDRIPPEDRCSKTEIKVLGLQWDHSNDTLRLTKSFSSAVSTKREVLKSVASVYDPLGLFQPIMLRAKVLLQHLWNQNKKWDEPMDADAITRWNQASRDILPVFDLYIPRNPQPVLSTDEICLVTFCDASKEAYGAAVYIRSKAAGDSAWHTELAFCKSRLAPRSKSSSTLSLPRLELMGLTIGARATTFVRKALEQYGSNIPSYVFSDSMCVLHWLRSTKLLSVFVDNRIKEIKRAGICEFFYVPTTENPADFITRGMDAVSLNSSKLWWNGPDWLCHPRDKWPETCQLQTIPQTVVVQTDSELRKSQQVFHTILAGGGSMEYPLSIDPAAHSSLSKLLRISVWCLKFLKAFVWDKLSGDTKDLHGKLSRIFDCVSPEPRISTSEFSFAKRMWVMYAQVDNLANVRSAILNKHSHSLIRQLGLTIDIDGIMRCCGRFQHADLSPYTIRPMLLPKSGHITKLIITDVHIRLFHSGIGHTLSQIRRECWIPQGRAVVRKVLHRCCWCRKLKGHGFALPEMPALPKERVSRSSPFQFIGLDYLGPMNVRIGGETKKMWICLFTCLAIRAVHLEWVSDCSAKEFLNCVVRFVARRGTPTQIISDNAPQFRVSKTVLDRVWAKVLTDETVSNYAATNGILWKFTTELAPWQGGFYERLVGIVKGTLRMAVGRRLLQWEEMLTLIAEVEAVVNSRPITYVYSDFSSGWSLCPSDFLTGQLSLSFPDTDPSLSVRGLGDAGQDLVRFWKYKQGRLKALWKFWYDEYLLSLRERGQTAHKGSRGEVAGKPSVGQVVIVKDTDAPRGMWKLAKVVNVIVGKDGLVRSAEVKLPNGSTLRRPINHIVPLEIDGRRNEAEINTTDDEQFDGFTEKEVDEATRRCQITQQARKNIERDLTAVVAPVLF